MCFVALQWPFKLDVFSYMWIVSKTHQKFNQRNLQLFSNNCCKYGTIEIRIKRSIRLYNIEQHSKLNDQARIPTGSDFLLACDFPERLQGPNLTCPDNFTVGLTSITGVSWDLSTLVNASEGASLSFMPVSPLNFDLSKVGSTTPVFVTAIDTHGKVAQCAFTVDVKGRTSCSTVDVNNKTSFFTVDVRNRMSHFRGMSKVG